MTDDGKQIHPKLIDKNQRWVGAIEKGIAGLDSKQQYLVMQKAGKDCASDIWALCEKSLGTEVKSVDDLVRGWNLVRKGRNLNGDWVIEGNTVHGLFEECGCPLVRSGLIELQPVRCWCSQNMMETVFSRAAKKIVSVEIKQSIGRGDKACEFVIIF